MPGTTLRQPSTVNLTAGVAKLLCAGRATRLYLRLQVTGSGDLTLGINDVSGPGITPGAGPLIYAGAAETWDGLAIPTDAVYGVSDADTTVIVLEG